MPSLTFLLPGLSGPFPNLHKDAVPRLAALETLLARSRKRRSGYLTFYQHLCGLFGVEQERGRDLPIAPLSRLVDDTERPEGIWMRADPVHLRAGLNDLMLIDTTDITLSQHDAILLGTPLHEIFNGLGWTFEIPMAKRWYLRLDTYPDAQTTEISEVRGKDVQHLMPQGGDRPRLDRLMTEVQMTLHNNHHNLEREWRGEPVLNSLWFWGCGRLPDGIDATWTKVISDDPVAGGLAIMSGIPFVSPPEDLETLLEDAGGSDNILLVRDDLLVYAGYQDFSAWEQSIDALEDSWFAPALDALQLGDLDRVTIISDGIVYRTGRYSLKKFWCRRRALI